MNCAKIAQLPLPTLVPLPGGAQARSKGILVLYYAVLAPRAPWRAEVVASASSAKMKARIFIGAPHRVQVKGSTW